MPGFCTVLPNRLVVAIAVAVACVLGVALTGNSQAPSPGADRITFRMIVVSSADAAEQVRQRLAAGENLVALARAESIDPSADQGGLVGPVVLSVLRPELRAALQNLAPGQLSPVVRVPTGFAVLQIVPEANGGSGATIDASEIPALAAVGNVKYTVSVDGFGEANSILESYEKPPDWNQDLRLICDMRQQSLAASRKLLETYLAPEAEAARQSEPPYDLVQAHFALGQIHAYQGKMEETIRQFERAHTIAREQVPQALPQLDESLGIAHLHKAEMDNGLYHEPGARCLLPTKGEHAFTNTADLLRAVDYFTKYLSRQPQELEVKWLLNLSYMALGAYPSKVPPQHLIPPTALDSRDDVGRFVDVAADVGLSSFSSAGGVIVDDFDNDGVFDILTSNFDSCGPMHYFRRGQELTFKELSSDAGLRDQLGGLNLVQTDYNNDGCRDVLVLRGGWETAQRKSLLQNKCDGTFTDVTAASGLAKPATSTQTAVWIDVDDDGWVDLFVGNEDSPAQLFRNRGDGTFIDIAASAGVNRSGFTKGVAAADYDNDGYPDLYVSNLGGGNALYRNNRNLTFTEMAQAAGVPGADRGFPTWFFDYDNDGWQDLFVSSYYLSVDESVRTFLALPHNATTMKLYRNLGNGGFQDVSAALGLEKVFMPMGSNFGDIDNDGFLDIYLGSGSPSYASMVRSVLLHNKEGKSFVDVTSSSGTGELHKGHGVAFADLDSDGDQDIVFKVGGATPGDAHAFRTFENPGHGNEWMSLRLVGEKTNRAGIGARIKVTVENAGDGTRTIHRVVTSGGSFGASPLEQHIGLGKSAQIRELEIWWPVSNTRQRFTNVTKNQALEIHELADRYVTLDRKAGALRKR